MLATGVLAQFGVAADPGVQARWQHARIPDEPNRAAFRAGTLSFAGRSLGRVFSRGRVHILKGT